MGFGFYFVIYVQGVCNGTQGIEARCSEITSQQKKQRGCGARPKTLNAHPRDYFLQQGSTSKRSITALNNSPTIIQIHEAVEDSSHSNHNRQRIPTSEIIKIILNSLHIQWRKQNCLMWFQVTSLSEANSYRISNKCSQVIFELRRKWEKYREPVV